DGHLVGLVIHDSDQPPAYLEPELQILLAVEPVTEVLAVDVGVDVHPGTGPPERFRAPMQFGVGEPTELATLLRRGRDGDLPFDVLLGQGALDRFAECDRDGLAYAVVMPLRGKLLAVT